jgi:hypothetical protein
MKKLLLPVLIIAVALPFWSARATTVISPSFDELVEQAQLIFQGTVIDVKCQWAGEGSQRRIESFVTFSVEDPIKGEPGSTYTLRMLGGTIAGETMGVADAPTFKKGDRDVLFVENNGNQFIPLVGIMYGRYRVFRDKLAGRDIVTDNTGGAVGGVVGLGVADFKMAIRIKLRSSTH